jgi:hypothetical protein
MRRGEWVEGEWGIEKVDNVMLSPKFEELTSEEIRPVDLLFHLETMKKKSLSERKKKAKRNKKE